MIPFLSSCVEQWSLLVIVEGKDAAEVISTFFQLQLDEEDDGKSDGIEIDIKIGGD